jgi:hypothetical protein
MFLSLTEPIAVDVSSIQVESITTNSAILTWGAVTIGDVDFYTIGLAPTTGGATVSPSTIAKAPDWFTRHTTSLKSLTAGTEYTVTIRGLYGTLRSTAVIKFNTGWPRVYSQPVIVRRTFWFLGRPSRL